jgi:predicted ATPase
MPLSRQYVIEVRFERANVPSFDEYPFSLPAIQHLQDFRPHPSVTFFIGENGSGKSTLLEAIAVACRFNPEGGSMNFSFTTRPSHSELHKYLRIVRGIRRPRTGYFLRAESFYNVASEIDRLDEIPAAAPPIKDSYGGVSLHKQSHGESFMALLTKRFSPSGSISSTSRKPPCHPRVSFKRSPASTSSSRAARSSSSPRIPRS